jgi:hypothetical protein
MLKIFNNPFLRKLQRPAANSKRIIQLFAHFKAPDL